MMYQFYKIYCTDDTDQREFKGYLYVIIGAFNRVEAYREAFDMYPHVVKWGAIVAHVTEAEQLTVLSSGLVAPVTRNAPKPTPSAAPATKEYILYQDSSKVVKWNQPKLGTAKVNWWKRGYQRYGARADKQSGKAYDVYSISDSWVTIHMGLGMILTVRRDICEYTPKAESAAA